MTRQARYVFRDGERSPWFDQEQPRTHEDLVRTMAKDIAEDCVVETRDAEHGTVHQFRCTLRTTYDVEFLSGQGARAAEDVAVEAYTKPQHSAASEIVGAFMCLGAVWFIGYLIIKAIG